MFDVDGALVGYGGIAPEPLIEMIAAGKAKDYAKARAIHDRLLPVTSNVYHRGSHMEGTRRAQVGARRPRHPRARDRPPAAAAARARRRGEIADAMRSAGLVGQTARSLAA